MEATDLRSDVTPLVFPAAPAEAAPQGFPVVATVAPLMAAGVIWAVTQSPFALVFAALSPVIALASVADGRRQSRRARRRASAIRARAIERLIFRVEKRQERELTERRSRAPSAAFAMSSAGRAGRWTGDADRFAMVSLGSGVVRSTVRIGGEPADDDERALRARFTDLHAAPIEADATLGIGLLGRVVVTRSVARGLLVQLAHAYPPGALAVTAVPDDGWEWAGILPHWNPDCRGHGIVRIISTTAPSARIPVDSDASRPAVIVLAESIDELTLPCRVVVSVDGPASAHLITAPDRGAVGDLIPELVPELISEQQALAYAGLLEQQAQASGLIRSVPALPERIGLAELEHAHVDDSSTSLNAAIGSLGDGPLTIDLVADGPHAVVAGTTGSGKSELLTTWVVALASAYPPAAVGFLLVDFKGGSAFAPLSRLPHCLGVITDLGPGEAERALRSLKAELRRRERMLADWGVRSIAETGGRLGRLVIVVDEFAAMLDGFPELHALFVDIAARGRSLGVHTILCTQRPAGVVRDALLANCALRISLRVHDAFDSVAVVGSEAASQLSAARPGRCVIARDGVRMTAQIAATAPDDIEAILRGVEADQASRSQRRPWLDPLPAVVALESLQHTDEAALLVGIEDVPEEQRQSVVELRPADGHLLVTGVHGAGKSTVLQTIAAQCGGAARLIHEPEMLWDELECALDTSTTGRGTAEPHPLLLIDDLDALIARMPDEYQDAVVESLARVLRDGPSSGVHVVAAAQRMTSPLRSCGPLFGSTLLLEQKDRHDYVLAGGPAELFDTRHRPGEGVWRGHRIQVARAELQLPPAEPARVQTIDFASGRTILVSRAPARRARELRESHPTSTVVEIGSASARDMFGSPIDRGYGMEVSNGSVAASPIVLVADPASWQSAWSLFSSLRAGSTIVFDGCSVADVRTLLHSRELPPLLTGSDRVWVLRPDSRFRRARLGA